MEFRRVLFRSLWPPILEIRLRHRVRIGRSEWHRRRERVARQFIENDAVAGDIDPEIFAALERLVYVIERMHDDIDGAPDARVAQDFGFGDIPVMRDVGQIAMADDNRAEEHTSELQSLMRTSYAVFRLKKNTQDICCK